MGSVVFYILCSHFILMVWQCSAVSVYLNWYLVRNSCHFIARIVANNKRYCVFPIGIAAAAAAATIRQRKLRHKLVKILPIFSGFVRIFQIFAQN